nr:hypothetical protein [Tanacetum cinerariifolium]
MPELMRDALYARMRMEYIDGDDEDEEIPQAVPPPPRTQGERIAKLEEDVHGMREELQGQRVVLDNMGRDFYRFTTWIVTSLAQLMNRTGVPYGAGCWIGQHPLLVAQISKKVCCREEDGALISGDDEDEEIPQAVPPPPRTQGERIAKLEEDVHGMREELQGQRVVLDNMARDFYRFTTWIVTSLAQLMNRTGVPYVRYSKSQVEYQRRTRHRTDGANTSTSLEQPDP